MAKNPWPVAFDSNVLTYFLDGNRGSYELHPGDSVAEQRIASVRLFLYCSTFVSPTVTAEALRITDPAKREEHLRFIYGHFGELDPDFARTACAARVAELRQHHDDDDDCRIVAEVEADQGIPVLVTYDTDLKKNLAPYVRIRIETPVECWNSLGIPRGTPYPRGPGSGHPLEQMTWWRWEEAV